jgi:hypothetical protein
VIICCDWASHERPWLSVEEDPEGNDPWLVESEKGSGT